MTNFRGMQAPRLPAALRGPQSRSRRVAQPSRRGAVCVRASAVCGIDLGTTNSAVAIVVDGGRASRCAAAHPPVPSHRRPAPRPGKPVILADSDGHKTLPSVVSYLADGTQNRPLFPALHADAPRCPAAALGAGLSQNPPPGARRHRAGRARGGGGAARAASVHLLVGQAPHGEPRRPPPQ